MYDDYHMNVFVDWKLSIVSCAHTKTFNSLDNNPILGLDDININDIF